MLIALGVASLVVVVALGIWLSSGDDDLPRDVADTVVNEQTDEQPSAELVGDELTAEEREAILARPEGPSDLRPLAAAGRADTSASLRDKLNRFAASTSSPAVRNSPRCSGTSVARTSSSAPCPARMDYSATNKAPNSACYKLYLEDQVVLGAAAGIWSDGVQGVLVNAIQLESPEAALALLLGHGALPRPRRGAVLRLAGRRHRHPPARTWSSTAPSSLSTRARTSCSRRSRTTSRSGPSRMVLAYQSLSLIGDTVLVASIGTSVIADPAQLTGTIDQAISAFTD